MYRESGVGEGEGDGNSDSLLDVGHKLLLAIYEADEATEAADELCGGVVVVLVLMSSELTEGAANF